MEIANKLVKEHRLSKEEFKELLTQWENPALSQSLKEEAVRLRDTNYGKKVYTRGLIEFTNYCKNNCYYCGIRCGNRNAQRYRLSKEDILSCCEEGYALGFRTFVLQGGEDPYFDDAQMTEIVKAIKKNYPDCAVTLSVGERTRESYARLKAAGADRYLLRHETANEEHYKILHPEQMQLKKRKECLYCLKELGFQTGAGFMVGSPGQTMDTLAEDLVFLQELKPQMVGIGPFIPHHDTCFAEKAAGSVELTLFLLAIVRILLPKVLLPATTALGTMDPFGREKGMESGANVVMPNLSPLSLRKKYSLYDNKICTGDEAAEGLKDLRLRLERIGYELSMERGDYKRT